MTCRATHAGAAATRCAGISEKLGDELAVGLDQADRDRLCRLLGTLGEARGPARVSALSGVR